MNILFLFQRFSFETSTIYLDLVDACVNAGHRVYVLAGTSEKKDTASLQQERGCSVAYVSLPDQFATGKIKKGLVQLLIEPIFISTLKRLMWQESIDIIAYPTPPITLAGVVTAAKRHFGATSVLMLKDIFPQNAADLSMMARDGLLFKYFKWVERRLYKASDVIGCMSPGNLEYIKNHNPEISDRLCVLPNTVRILPFEGKRSTPGDKLSFILGGNLGKPQGIDFLLEGIKSLSDEGFADAEFMIVGTGTEASYVRQFLETNSLNNCVYREQLPRDEYEDLLSRQDVGIISLSHKFTIPNFPSRLLSYMQMGKPVFVVADGVTDMSHIVEKEAKCGFFAPAGDVEAFKSCIKRICEDKEALWEYGMNGRSYLEKHYDVKSTVVLLESIYKKEKK